MVFRFEQHFKHDFKLANFRFFFYLTFFIVVDSSRVQRTENKQTIYKNEMYVHFKIVSSIGFNHTLLPACSSLTSLFTSIFDVYDCLRERLNDRSVGVRAQ